MRKLFSIPDEKETRLWNRYMSNTFEPLNKPDSTIQDAGLYQGQVGSFYLNSPQCENSLNSPVLFLFFPPNMACYVDSYYS